MRFKVTYTGKDLKYDQGDEYTRTFRSAVLRMVGLLGIKYVESDIVDANALSRAVIKSIDFRDEAPDGIRDYASIIIPCLCDILASIGVSGAEVILDDEELSVCSKMWADTTDKAIDKAQTDNTVEDIDKYRKAVSRNPISAVELSRVDESSKKSSDTDQPLKGLMAVKIDLLYDNVARLLPMEGRDYSLNPRAADTGGIHLDPVAYTKIGKIWLEYLKETLPLFSVADENGKEEILNAKP